MRQTCIKTIYIFKKNNLQCKYQINQTRINIHVKAQNQPFPELDGQIANFI